MRRVLVYQGALYRQSSHYVDEGFVGSRWGQRGSGLLLTTGTRILLLLRSDLVAEPGTWGVPGGAIPTLPATDEFQDAQKSAVREAMEELGSVPPHRIIDKYIYTEPSGFIYTTFIGFVDPEVAYDWEPHLNWENDAYRWVRTEDLAELDLHFGVDAVLRHKFRVLFNRQRRGSVRVAAPLQVVDFRDPDFKLDWSHPGGEQAAREAQKAAHVSIGKTKIFLYNWGRGNLLGWKELRDKIHQDKASLTKHDIVLLKNGGVLLDESPGDWGTISRFSSKIVDQLQPLHEVGLIKPDSVVWLGNWAGLRGKKIGTVGEFLEKKNLELPDQLVLYHGTSNVAAEDILREGLVAQPVQRRVWHRDVLSKHPDWRGSAVYLTVDLYQAHYYATKAMNVLRRHGYRGVSPVVLKVVIPKEHFDKFLPDDDYLAKVYGRGKGIPKQLDLFRDPSWLASLGEMSQVAYLGSIPPEWISVESRLSKHKYKEPYVV